MSLNWINHEALSDGLKPEPKPAFRIVFKVRDGQIMQVNTVEKRQPSQFLKVGDTIAGTKLKIISLKIIKLEYSDIDSSEIIVQNPDTKKSLVVVLGITVDVSSLDPL